MFIHINWKKNHILYRDKNFFLYEHQNNNKVNYVLSLNDNNDIISILGFIKASNNIGDVFTVMWKTLKNLDNPMLGIELLEYLRNSDEAKRVIGVGANVKTIPIYNY